MEIIALKGQKRLASLMGVDYTTKKEAYIQTMEDPNHADGKKKYLGDRSTG